MSTGVNLGVNIGVNTGSGGFRGQAWILAFGHYVSTLITSMPPVIIYPRPHAETTVNAYCKNAYPGQRWEIPIVVQGGAWPFKYELIGNPPAGMAIGSTLDISGDKQIVGDAYALLYWPNPIIGSYVIDIRVTDQDGTIKLVQWTLEVGKTKFIWIDEILGDDNNDGILVADNGSGPLKTFNVGVYESDDNLATYAGKLAIFKAGSYTINNGITKTIALIKGTTKPLTYVAYHDGTNYENAIFNFSDGFMRAATSSADFFLGHINCSNSDLDAESTRVIHLTPEGDMRATIHGCAFNNITKGTGGSDNPGCIVAAGLTTPTMRKYVSVTRCILESTSTVQLYGGFNTSHFVAEHNFCDGANLEAINNGNTYIHPKDDHPYCTIRRNTIINATQGNSPFGIYEFGGQDADNSNQELCWNVAVVEALGESFGTKWGNNAFTSSNKHCYRNTLVISGVNGTAMEFLVDGTNNLPIEVEGNASYASTTYIGGTDGVNYNDNGNQLLLSADFDVNGNLTNTNSARDFYLGTMGHEVA